jgi:hypothetical protein
VPYKRHFPFEPLIIPILIQLFIVLVSFICYFLKYCVSICFRQVKQNINYCLIQYFSNLLHTFIHSYSLYLCFCFLIVQNALPIHHFDYELIFTRLKPPSLNLLNRLLEVILVLYLPFFYCSNPVNYQYQVLFFLIINY